MNDENKIIGNEKLQIQTAPVILPLSKLERKSRLKRLERSIQLVELIPPVRSL